MSDTYGSLSGPTLARAAALFARQPEYLGYWLELYRNRERVELTALTRHLGCELETLHRLSLCFRPRPERLEEDTRELSERYGVDQDRLADLVLMAEAYAAHPEGETGQAGVDPRATMFGAVLVAASDREEEPEAGPFDGGAGAGDTSIVPTEGTADEPGVAE